MKKQLKLGGHLSASQGLRYVVANARALNYDVVQTMVGGGRDYNPFDIDEVIAVEYKNMMYGIDTYVHLPYIINPCESTPQRRAFYKRTFKAYCLTASRLGAKGVIVHPGFKKDLTTEVALGNLVAFFSNCYEEEWALDILIETDAGSKNGSAIGTVKFIREAIDTISHNAFGMCWDTVHMYANGQDLWDTDVRTSLLEEYGHMVRLVHLNSPDPKVSLGNHLDRHNTPFEDRPTWDHSGLINDLGSRYPLILERSSLAVQEKDSKFVRECFL